MNKFFFDNTTSYRLVNGLKAFGEDVVHLRDRFAQNTPDEEWIPVVGGEHLFVVTHDKRLRRNPAQRKALLDAGLGVFLLASSVSGHCEVITMVVDRWPEIKQAASREARPFVLQVPHRGKIKRLG